MAETDPQNHIPAFRQSPVPYEQFFTKMIFIMGIRATAV
jgi:hypothetical protein